MAREFSKNPTKSHKIKRDIKLQSEQDVSETKLFHGWNLSSRSKIRAGSEIHKVNTHEKLEHDARYYPCLPYIDYFFILLRTLFPAKRIVK